MCSYILLQILVYYLPYTPPCFVYLISYCLLFLRAKLTPENKHGDTALEVARNWGDEYIYALVYAEASRLPPPPSDGKKGKRMVYVGERQR